MIQQSGYWHPGSGQDIDCEDDFSTAAGSTATKSSTHLCNNIEINEGLTNILITFQSRPYTLCCENVAHMLGFWNEAKPCGVLSMRKSQLGATANNADVA